MALKERELSGQAVELPEPWRSAALTVVLPTYNEAANLPVIVGGAVQPAAHRTAHPRRRRQLAGRDWRGRRRAGAAVRRGPHDGSAPAGQAGPGPGLRRRHDAGHCRGRRFRRADGQRPVALPAVPAADARHAAREQRRRRHRLALRLRCQPGQGVVLAAQGTVRPSRTLTSALLLRLGVRDVTAGFKLWRSSALTTIDVASVRSNGYSFQVEMNYRSDAHGLKMVEAPDSFRRPARGREQDESQGAAGVGADAAVPAPPVPASQSLSLVALAPRARAETGGPAEPARAFRTGRSGGRLLRGHRRGASWPAPAPARAPRGRR